MLFESAGEGEGHSGGASRVHVGFSGLQPGRDAKGGDYRGKRRHPDRRHRSIGSTGAFKLLLGFPQPGDERFHLFRGDIDLVSDLDLIRVELFAADDRNALARGRHGDREHLSSHESVAPIEIAGWISFQRRAEI